MSKSIKYKCKKCGQSNSKRMSNWTIDKTVECSNCGKTLNKKRVEEIIMNKKKKSILFKLCKPSRNCAKQPICAKPGK